MISPDGSVLERYLSTIPEPERCSDYSLANGAALYSLCAYTVHARTGDRAARSLAASYFERVVALVNDADNTSSLFRGIAGVGFVASVMESEDYSGLLDDIDSAILDGLSAPNRINIDIVHGLSGIMIYGMQRSAKNKCKVIEVSVALADAWLRAWLKQDHALASSRQAKNIGAAHGVTGLVLMSCNAARAAGKSSVDVALLTSCVERLIKSQINADYGPTFPYSEGGKEPGRLAWCYGDLGLLVLFHAYWRLTGLQADRLEALALSVAERGVLDPSLRDASICHGYSGLALIMSHIEDAGCLSKKTLTQISNIKDAATLKSKRLATDADVRTYVRGKYLPSASLLEGGAGVALALDHIGGFVASPWKRVLGIF